MKDYKDKLKKEINYHLNNVKKSGSSRLETCDHYLWDKDIWNHRHTIINKLRDEGLNVRSQMNWGVLDITITEKEDA